MRIRGLKVWFPLRRGLARELVGGGSIWVRALDGVSFDVRRGEVFCLVGESGCGKTTTGKALLRLVEATEGDVFLEMPEDDFAEYGRLRTKQDGPETRERVDQLRRKYSLTWTETIPWTVIQAMLLAMFFAAGLVSSVFVPAALAGLFPRSFAGEGSVLGLSVLSGLLLGIIAALPPTRPYRRTPVLLALLSIAALNLVPIVASALFPASMPEAVADPFGTLGAVWGESTFALLIGICVAPSLAGGVSRMILGIRGDREGLSGIKMRTLRRRLHLIFQDPYESLNPKQSVFEIVSEPLIVNRVSTNPEEVAALVSHSLEDAGLRPAEEFMFRFPHELSGGQRQRVSIAAALALEPDFIVADEPVSMLDVSIRTEIIQLMMDLRERRGLTYLFITHDLSLAWVLADHVAVMYLGKIVEQGSAEQVIAHPKHPYTQALISVVPSPDPRHKASRTILKGERPDPVDIPTGCRFHPRCAMAFERCGWNAGEVKAVLDAVLPSALPGRVGVARVQSPTRLTVQPLGTNAQELADTLRGFIREKRDEQLALRGIADVSASGSDVVLTMHPHQEPELLEVEPGNTVACHLVAPVAQQPPAVPAA